MTLPVVDTLRENFPHSRISVIVGPKAADLFVDDFRVNMIIYDKHIRLKSKLGFLIYLRKQRFHMIVDLRHSGFSLFLKAPYKTSSLLKIPKTIEHMKYRHLYKLKSTNPAITKFYSTEEIPIKQDDKDDIDEILSENRIKEDRNLVLVSAGAASHWKRYRAQGFAKLCDYLIENYKVKIVFVGNSSDKSISQDVVNLMKNNAIDLCGRTTLRQLAYLMKKAKAVISNDSAVMHMASYLDIPTLAIFGPTDPKKYGPWNRASLVARKELDCVPCEQSSCRFNHECMNTLGEDVVIKQAKRLLDPKFSKDKFSLLAFPVYKRILIVRTDRIGDVLLSTPVIKAVKDYYPNSYLAFMVRPYAKDIVEGNPDVDEVIVYDKFGEHRRILSSIKFALALKKRKFDLAVILHPTNRVNLITFFAAIPERVGYDRKLGILLSKKLKHTKQEGAKHEMEYSLDVVRSLGIEPKDKSLFMPLKQESEDWADNILKENNLSASDNIVAIHPGASCPSKIWPQKNFSELANKLAESYKARIIVIAGPSDELVANTVLKGIKYPVVNLAGKTSVSQLASILKRCRLFISNDSGPVHIATAVGTPVISIFGRKQPGLSPKRWGPLGEKDKVLHKDVGCIECLAHNCKKDFICLKAITVEDVIEAITYGMQ